jgi:hypothetical protein
MKRCWNWALLFLVSVLIQADAPLKNSQKTQRPSGQTVSERLLFAHDLILIQCLIFVGQLATCGVNVLSSGSSHIHNQVA